jgi:transposase
MQKKMQGGNEHANNGQDIRFRFFMNGENVTQIANSVQLDRRTVQKYIDWSDFNEPKPASEQRFCPKLEPYKSIIDKWLQEDKQAPRKQRHTAKRVFNRLKNKIKGFSCSYITVATYYAAKHKEFFKELNSGLLPLEHKPGEVQVDFGAANFYENGRCVSGKYLEVSFPYSNNCSMQLFHGENMECLLEGLDAIFRHIGAVPHEAWFDNM